MIDKKPSSKDILPSLLKQNPSPVEKDSQDRKHRVREQVDRIMEVFLQLLPSNYVSQISGPFYTLQFQAAAEQIADFQVTAQESFADTQYDYTRPEFLFQILGTLVFPDAHSDGYPQIDGDLTFRYFLQRMVVLLLQGATKLTIEEGLRLLADAAGEENVDFEVIERGLSHRELGASSGWTLDDQFTFEVNVTKLVNGLPLDPFTLQENVRIVMRALKPAHTLYDYRHLFQETFGALFTDTISFEMSNYFYEDFRHWCQGIKQISGTGGITWTDRTLFSDPTRDFGSVSPGAELTLSSELNTGTFRVVEVLAFPVGEDLTARPYTTSPSGLSGKATVEGGAICDATQNWAQVQEGEILTFSAGPNAGSYRLKTLLGSMGGLIPTAPGPADRVRPAPSILRLDRRMKHAGSGQAYEVSVDRLGAQKVHAVTQEDASEFFCL